MKVETPPIKLSYSQNVILEVLGVIKEDVVDTVSVEDIVRVVSKDPSFTVRLLAIANSPVFSSGKVNNIEQALFVLGIDAVRMIAMWILFYESPSTLIPLHILDKLRLHAGKVAVATAIVGEAAKDKNYNQRVYFLAGLLHDIGKVFIKDEKLADSLEWMIALKGAELLNVESEYFGIAHPAQGREVLTLLNLPSDIVCASAFHHDYGRNRYAGGHDDLVSSVYLAENLLSFISNAPGDDGEWSVVCEKILSKKKLTDKVVLEIERKLNAEEAFFI